MHRDVQEILYEVNLILDKIHDKAEPEDVLNNLAQYVATKRLEFVQPQGDCV